MQRVLHWKFAGGWYNGPVKKIIIVGAGFVGMQLARTLVAEGRSVVLIDKDADRGKEAGNQIDCAVVLSDGNGPAALEEAGIASADALVAVTEQDELNMITCAYVEAHYPGVFRIARVRNYDYYESASPVAGERHVYGIDRAIHPNMVTAEAILAAIRNGMVGETVDLGKGFGIVWLTVEKESPLYGRSLKTLSTLEGWAYLVVSIERGSVSILPDGETVLQEGDQIGVVARQDEFASLKRFASVESGSARRTVIYGAGPIGYLLAADRNLKKVTVVDSDRERCRKVAEQIRKAHVICGSLTEEDIVAEERLDENDLFVAVSDNYDQNLVVAAYMKSLGVAKTIALTSSAAVGSIARKLGVDVAIPMRDSVVDGIMGSLRGRNVLSVHTVCGGSLEILTCVVGTKARAVGKSLRELALPGVFLVLLVQVPGKDQMRVPRGDHVVQGGERIVIIAQKGDDRVIRLFGDR